MKTSTDASIFHMAFELELHVDTNKNKDYFLHGTTYNVLAPSDCFYYHYIFGCRVVDNAHSQTQSHLEFMQVNSQYKVDDYSGDSHFQC